ncbi:class I SAM-dependent methyltransferase [Cohnella zeiphila]|uniref:Class I SAM-dependent methyltransferase n=1 Tax=Cohnella zeiphila TaxID=2761120 RepID=A0A7X0SS50_9BACL|nr:class I SAM-dependent methyltransferase [Cohnella zeiphila]MBB6734099.1 class I SAM-dependent methyltransferase [Cohnella zeiphila]
MNHERLIRKFDKQAKIYEARRKRRSEGMWREKLIRTARGDVLEVGVGAGANFPFYSREVQVTAVDFSPAMLEKAREAASDSGIRAEFKLRDTESLSFPDDSFDTVVSTLTLCGYENPLAVLRSMRKWCRPEGRILLMEHGIGSNRLIGLLQSAMNPLFRQVVGCHLNRDMMGFIRESGIRVNRAEHYLGNAVHLVWANPNKTKSS